MESGWHIRRGDDDEEHNIGANLTEAWRELVEEARRGESTSLPAEAADYVYFLVPGLFTNKYGDGYMRDVVETLTKMGLDARKLNLNTEAGVDDNAEEVRHCVESTWEKEGKRVVLVGHSKGGVDAATAVAKHELYDKVRALVALQSPFGGTPFADAADEGGLIETLHNIASALFKADEAAVFDLRYKERRKAMEAHPYDTTRLPTLCFISAMGEQRSMMGPMANFLRKKHGIDSDGAVPVLDAHVAGADYVRVHGLDHGGTVFLSGRRKATRGEKLVDVADASDDNPGDIAYAMIVLALQKRQDELLGRTSKKHDRSEDEDDEDKKHKSEEEEEEDDKSAEKSEEDKSEEKSEKDDESEKEEKSEASEKSEEESGSED